MIQILTTAFMLGLVFNAAPGAVFAETIKRSMSGGYREALFLQLGSLVGDALWAILGLLGIGVLLQSPAMQLPVAMAGAAYLAYLAWDSWAASNAPIQSSASHKANIKTSAKSTQSAARAGVIISATNPQNIAYWAAIGSAFGALGITQPQPLDYALFFSGFMLSSLLWCFFCAALVSKLFGKAGNKWKVITYRLCAIAFFYLACGTLYKAIANFG
ncbi:LysE family translocator [Alphaproteobacteria bacterium]|jgi:chemosensory pili system protein ChpE/L-lysine exporter family protein LysE/ArgO|nr:LysE family translocator [Alphaproteobacteria bacterium]